MVTSIHGAFHSKGWSKQLVTTVLMDRILLCTAHLTHRHESFLTLQVFISGNAIRVVFFFGAKPNTSQEATKTSSVTPQVPTSILLHSSWHGQGRELGDGKISAYFLFVTFADSEIWEEQQAATDSITYPYHAGIQLCGLHRAFPRQAFALTVYVASQKTAGKNCKLLNFANCTES